MVSQGLGFLEAYWKIIKIENIFHMFIETSPDQKLTFKFQKPSFPIAQKQVRFNL